MDFKVLVADTIAAEGVEFLQRHASVDVRTGMPVEQLLSNVGQYDALIVRSETRVSADVLEEIGRAHV